MEVLEHDINIYNGRRVTMEEMIQRWREYDFSTTTNTTGINNKKAQEVAKKRVEESVWASGGKGKTQAGEGVGYRMIYLDKDLDDVTDTQLTGRKMIGKRAWKVIDEENNTATFYGVVPYRAKYCELFVIRNKPTTERLQAEVAGFIHNKEYDDKGFTFRTWGSGSCISYAPTGAEVWFPSSNKGAAAIMKGLHGADYNGVLNTFVVFKIQYNLDDIDDTTGLAIFAMYTNKTMSNRMDLPDSMSPWFTFGPDEKKYADPIGKPGEDPDDPDIPDVPTDFPSDDEGGSSDEYERPVTEMSLNVVDAVFKVGTIFKLHPTFKPANTDTPLDVTWKATNPDVVHVDSAGNVRCIAVGSGSVVCTLNAIPQIEAYCTIDVVAEGGDTPPVETDYDEPTGIMLQTSDPICIEAAGEFPLVYAVSPSSAKQEVVVECNELEYSNFKIKRDDTGMTMHKSVTVTAYPKGHPELSITTSVTVYPDISLTSYSVPYYPGISSPVDFVVPFKNDSYWGNFACIATCNTPEVSCTTSNKKQGNNSYNSLVVTHAGRITDDSSVWLDFPSIKYSIKLGVVETEEPLSVRVVTATKSRIMLPDPYTQIPYTIHCSVSDIGLDSPSGVIDIMTIGQYSGAEYKSLFEDTNFSSVTITVPFAWTPSKVSECACTITSDITGDSIEGVIDIIASRLYPGSSTRPSLHQFGDYYYITACDELDTGLEVPLLDSVYVKVNGESTKYYANELGFAIVPKRADNPKVTTSNINARATATMGNIYSGMFRNAQVTPDTIYTEAYKELITTAKASVAASNTSFLSTDTASGKSLTIVLYNSSDVAISKTDYKAQFQVRAPRKLSGFSFVKSLQYPDLTKSNIIDKNNNVIAGYHSYIDMPIEYTNYDQALSPASVILVCERMYYSYNKETKQFEYVSSQEYNYNYNTVGMCPIYNNPNNPDAYTFEMYSSVQIECLGSDGDLVYRDQPKSLTFNYNLDLWLATHYETSAEYTYPVS